MKRPSLTTLQKYSNYETGLEKKMILDTIKIQNIRSVKNLELTFPQTTMLFLGDIGSGKSSVLKAIEFAMFGVLKTSDLSGDSLLRRGESKASVELTFLIEDNRFTVTRGLSKSSSGNISQTRGALIVNGQETPYSVTDLRRKILEILNYSVIRYERAHSIDLFRYTVYTPQESVKQILEAKPEDRFEILKDVFDIKKYEVAKKNLEIINKYLGKEISQTETQLAQLEGTEEALSEMENQYKEQQKKIAQLEKDRDAKKNQIDQLQGKYNKLNDEKEEISKKLVELEGKLKLLQEKIKTKEDTKSQLNTIHKGIEKNREDLSKIPKIELSSELTKEQLNQRIKDLRVQISENERTKAVIEQKIKDYDKLLEEGKCSLCGQEIHEKKRFDQELKEAKKKVETYSNDIENLAQQLKENDKFLEELSNFNKNQNNIELYQKLVEAGLKQERESESKLNEIDLNIHALQEKIEIIKKSYNIDDLETFETLENDIKEEIKSLGVDLEILKNEKTKIDVDLSGENKEKEYLEKEITKFKENIEKQRTLGDKFEYLKDLRVWTKEQFPTLLIDIEKQILVSSAGEFNKYFNEWFNILVEEGNIEVEINPVDFEPVINVNGYDSPFHDLSGGEKSAISLAYRLALTKVINERYQEVKTKDLLILDEPTDGFSQQQVNRMQEIFESLDTSQMIIISHERTLESFVTDIFSFKKERHKTRVNRE